MRTQGGPSIPGRGGAGYLDVSAELGGETLLLHVFNGSFTSEQVDGHAGRQEALMLLPLQRLKEDTEVRLTRSASDRRRPHTHVWSVSTSPTCPSRAMRREGGTTLTSPASA